MSEDTLNVLEYEGLLKLINGMVWPDDEVIKDIKFLKKEKLPQAIKHQVESNFIFDIPEEMQSAAGKIRDFILSMQNRPLLPEEIAELSKLLNKWGNKLEVVAELDFALINRLVRQTNSSNAKDRRRKDPAKKGFGREVACSAAGAC